MTSAFKPWANATLILEVPGVGLETDPTTGNVTPVTGTVEAIALLKRSNLKENNFSKSAQLQAQNAEEVYVVGYLVEPMQLPQGLTFPLTCNCTIDGHNGRLRIPMLLTNPYGVELVTGRKIEAFFLKTE